jgi:opacity protein-like surface antigen
MKKKMIYSSALATLLSVSSIALAGGIEIIPIEDYFSGFYVGGMGGVHHVDFGANSKLKVQTATSPAGTLNPEFIFTGPLASVFSLVPGATLATNDVDGASVDGYGGIQGGFGWTFNHVWYVGVQGFGEWGTQNSTQSTETPIESDFGFFPPSSIEAISVLDTSTKTSITNDYGVVAKLGYVVAPKTLVYGKIGASWATIKVSNSAEVVDSVNLNNGFNQTVANSTIVESGSSDRESSGKIGLVLGIGAEQFVYQDIISVNIEYNYVNYGTVNTGPTQLFATQTTFTDTGSGSVVVGPEINNTPTALTTQASTNARVNSFLAGINFYFGRDWF